MLSCTYLPTRIEDKTKTKTRPVSQSVDRVKSSPFNLSSPSAPQAHLPASVPRVLSVPDVHQTQNQSAPQKRARSCSQDKTRPSPALVSKAGLSESAMLQSTLLPCTSQGAVDDRAHSFAEPVLCWFPHTSLLLARLHPREVWGETHLIKVYFDATHVRRAHRNHAKKPVPPAPKHRNAFIQHEQILRAFCHPR